jgi:hypothetical protein
MTLRAVSRVFLSDCAVLLIKVEFPHTVALIISVGAGISASLARCLSVLGVRIALAARDIEKLNGLAEETGAKTFATDASPGQEPQLGSIDFL